MWAGRVLGQFWVAKGVIIVDYLAKKQTINLAYYCTFLRQINLPEAASLVQMAGGPLPDWAPRPMTRGLCGNPGLLAYKNGVGYQ